MTTWPLLRHPCGPPVSLISDFFYSWCHWEYKNRTLWYVTQPELPVQLRALLLIFIVKKIYKYVSRPTIGNHNLDSDP